MVNRLGRLLEEEGLELVRAHANTPEAWSERARTATTPQEAVGWTAAGQSERFLKVLDALAPAAGETLLDYGCGTGALIDHLPAAVEYVGYDFATGMIIRARREHPGVTFRESDHLLRADVIACIGTFNLPGSKQETWHALRNLWYDIEPRCLAVSLYAGDDERCLKYGMDETWRALGGFSHRVTVKSWRYNDILAVVTR